MSNIQDRHIFFDIIRGFGILYIIAVHHGNEYYGGILNTQLDSIVTYNILGALFFISGYLLASKYAINKYIDISNFLKKRFMRIYPLYVLAIVTFYFVFDISIKTLFLNAAFVSIVTRDSLLTLWFVSIACSFYLMYPLIMYKYSFIKLLFLTTVLFIAGLTLYLLSNNKYLDIRFVLYLPIFSAGIFLSKHQLLIFKKNVFLLLSITAFLSFSYSFIHYLDINHQAFKYLSQILMMLSFSHVLFFLHHRLSTYAVPKFVIILSYSSYAMYLLHRQLFEIAYNTVIFNSNFSKILLMIIFLVPFLIFFSYYFQKIYDNLVIYFLSHESKPKSSLS